MIFQSISDWFWDPIFWLPPNIQWSDIKSTNEKRYPESSDLWVPLYLAVLVMLIRYMFERFVAMPLGRILKLADHQPIAKCKVLKNGGPGENANGNGIANQNGHYKRLNRESKLDQPRTAKNVTQTGSIFRALQWLRRPAKPGPLTKFSESCWRFTYYVLAFGYGIVMLWDTVTPGMYWYYMIEMAFYWSLMFTQFKDVRRKDFWQMFTHHICTILLMTFSWIDNMVRMGTLVLVIHDAVDFWMEAAKMANYCKSHKLCNTVFTIFAVMWFLTRLLLYPYRVIYPALFIAHLNMDSFFGAYYLYNGLLILLFVLHVIWFVTIVRIAAKSIRCGKVEKDDRSSSEQESDGEIEEEKGEQPKLKSGPKVPSLSPQIAHHKPTKQANGTVPSLVGNAKIRHKVQ